MADTVQQVDITQTEGRSRGRPSLFTPDRCEKILSLIRQGNYIEIACRAAGVDYNTFRGWIQAAEAGDMRYSDFAYAVKQAEADHESSMVPELMTSKDDSIRLRMLGRRYRDRWSEQTTLNVNTQAQVTHTLELGAGDAQAFLQAYLAMQPSQAQLQAPEVIDAEPIAGDGQQ